MAWRPGAAAFAAALMFTAPTYAGGPFNVTGATVLTETGQKMDLRDGDNPIDQQTQMDCVSAAGCSIVIQSKMYFEGNVNNDRITWYCIRSLADEVEAQPQCKKRERLYAQNVVEAGSFQTIDVAQGTHTVQTGIFIKKFFVDRKYKGKLFNWIITYTMYDH